MFQKGTEKEQTLLTTAIQSCTYLSRNIDHTSNDDTTSAFENKLTKLTWYDLGNYLWLVSRTHLHDLIPAWFTVVCHITFALILLSHQLSVSAAEALRNC